MWPTGCPSPSRHTLPFLKLGEEGWPGGLGQLGPATAGLSVKGLPVTKNFLRVQTGHEDRDREGGSRRPQGGQSCRQPDRTRPRPRHLPCASWSEWHWGPAAPPLLPSHGLSHGPPGGLEALPCQRVDTWWRRKEQEKNTG